MDVTDVTPQLDRLEEELGKAKETLQPLLGDIGDISTKLPLLDRAKLYVLVSYTIESLLFCQSVPFLIALIRPLTHRAAALRLNGVETKNHAIFTELTRVKQYMEKIQKLEAPPAERETKVNTEATARFLKSDLVRRCHHTQTPPLTDTEAGRQPRHQSKVDGAHCQGTREGCCKSSGEEASGRRARR